VRPHGADPEWLVDADAGARLAPEQREVAP
jgi:hypothetical protein